MISWLLLVYRTLSGVAQSRTFLAGHANELWTMDLTAQPLWDYSVRCVLVFMELRSRGVVHVAVTASPTLAGKSAPTANDRR